MQRHDVYRWLNDQLVGFAGIERCRRVLDLGCGTGATTRRALADIDVMGEVVGLDASKEMVEVARASTVDPRARFHVMDAARLDPGDARAPFDGALSNAAFWQFGRPEVSLRFLGRHLVPGSPFAFNVPASRVGHTGPTSPLQISLARAVESRTGQPFQPTATRFDLDAVEQLASEAGLRPEAREVRSWEGPQLELIQLMRIPAMIEPVALGLSPEQAQACVEEASRGLDPDRTVRVGWVFVRFRRDDSQTP